MAIEVRVPTLGESVVEASIGRWLKRVGDTIKVDDPLVELETDKVNVEVPATSAGVLAEIKRQEGETVAINDVLAVIATNGNIAVPPAATAPPVVEAVAPVVEESKKATPVAKHIADANHVDIAQVKGSGAGGKVTKEDVQAHLQGQPTAVASTPVTPPQPTPPAVAPKAVTDDPRIERKPMSRRRRVIAANLVKAQQTAAMLTTFNEVDMGAVMDLRKRRGEAFLQKHGVKLGFMSFFAKAVVGALKQYPLLNAEIDGEDLLIKHYYDIGVAVGTNDGLVVPVLRGVDTKSFATIEKEIGDLATRARSNKLAIAELQGGTFTVTNGGIYGSLMSTPILSYPQVGILGMHKIQDRPMVVKGEIVVRPMMYLALSYDHRIVDGSEAVRFLVAIKEMIEDPEQMLLEG